MSLSRTVVLQAVPGGWALHDMSCSQALSVRDAGAMQAVHAQAGSRVEGVAQLFKWRHSVAFPGPVRAQVHACAERLPLDGDAARQHADGPDAYYREKALELLRADFWAARKAAALAAEEAGRLGREPLTVEFDSPAPHRAAERAMRAAVARWYRQACTVEHGEVPSGEALSLEGMEAARRRAMAAVAQTAPGGSLMELAEEYAVRRGAVEFLSVTGWDLADLYAHYSLR